MKQCRKCGRKGFFLQLSCTSLCRECERKEDEARHAKMQKELDDAKSYIRQMGYHISEATEHTTILYSWGATKINYIQEHCQYVLDHIDDWKKYPRFREAFRQTLIERSTHSESPLFPNRRFTVTTYDFEKLFAEVRKDVNRIHGDCIMASFRSYDYSRVFKVVGVTFKNGNKSRQTILRKIRFGDPPFDGYVQFKLERHLYEGEDAVAVQANGETVGHISKTDLPWVLDHWSEYYNITDYDIPGGNGLNYGLDIRVGFRKKP